MARMTFDIFKADAERHGLTARDCGDGHWQLRGGRYLVNVYARKDGLSYYINGTQRGSKRAAPLREIIEAARNIPRKLRLGSTQRKKSYRQFKAKLLESNPHCCKCGITLDRHTATIEHIIPLSRGGSNGMDNLALACAKCNNERGNALPEKTRWETNNGNTLHL